MKNPKKIICKDCGKLAEPFAGWWLICIECGPKAIEEALKAVREEGEI